MKDTIFNTLFRFDAYSQKLILPILVTLLSALFLLLVRSVIFRFLDRWSKKTQNRLDDTFVGALRFPSLFWCFALGIYLGIIFSEIPVKLANQLTQVMNIVLIFSVTIAAANLVVTLYRHVMHISDSNTGTSGLAIGLLRSFIHGIGLLLILSVLGIDIKPMLAALGVGGLAVALALKDTLENLFAGLYLLTDRTIRVGDLIKLESGQEGTVEDISWRTTRVRLTMNSTVILPNTKLSQSIVTNYSLPEAKLIMSIPFAMGIENDISKIEKLVTELFNNTDDIEGLLKEPLPCVRLLLKSSESALEFNVIVGVKQYSDMSFVQHEIKKRCYQLFAENGISKPQSTINLIKA